MGREEARTRQKKGHSYHACKGKLAQEQVRAPLILPDLAQGDGARSVPPSSRGRVAIRRRVPTCTKEKSLNEKGGPTHDKRVRQLRGPTEVAVNFKVERSTTYADSMGLHEGHHRLGHRHRHRHHRHRHRRRGGDRAALAWVRVHLWIYAPSAPETP